MKSKSTRSAMMSDSDIDTESIASVTKQVRKNIALWIGKQQSKLQDLKENDDITSPYLSHMFAKAMIYLLL